MSGMVCATQTREQLPSTCILIVGKKSNNNKMNPNDDDDLESSQTIVSNLFFFWCFSYEIQFSHGRYQVDRTIVLM